MILKINSMGKVKAIAWFSTMKGTVGIAVTENGVGEEKGRIMQIDGYDETVDILNVANYGTEFPLEEAKSICKKRGKPCNVEY